MCIRLQLVAGNFFTIIVKKISDDSDNAIVYIDHWTVIDEAGNQFETGRFYDDQRAYKENFTIVSKLPDEIGYGKVLCFMNGSDVNVYINGELRKDFKNERDTGIPGGLLKEFYLQVPLSTSDEGAEIRIE